MKDFPPHLKEHILGRLLNNVYEGDERQFTSAQRNSIHIINNQLYRHKVLRVNYTTYDLRRAQDSLNPRTQADVMVLAHEDESENPHPYWYAQIIGVFHVMVRHTGSESRSTAPQHIEFLWVHWLGCDLTYQAGWAAKRLPHIGFLDHDDPSAFGFLDPLHVIRGMHLIPGFAHGTSQQIPSDSPARQTSDDIEDWNCFYVNMCVINQGCRHNTH